MIKDQKEREKTEKNSMTWFLILMTFFGTIMIKADQNKRTPNDSSSMPFVGVCYHPYTVSLYRGITQPCLDYSDWTEERMKRDIKRASSAGIDFLLISIDAWETKDSARITSYRTFFDLLENSNLFACFSHEAHNAEHQDNVDVADWVYTNFVNNTAYFKWKDHMLLMVYDCIADENFEDPRFTIRHTVWRKEWQWFDPLNPTPVLSRNSEQTIIFPGYCPGGHPEKGWICPRDNGTFYKNQWEQALQLKPEIILIATWNDFWEGTFIEPNNLDGYLMSGMTEYYTQSAHFKSGWTRVGALYTWSSSPGSPFVLTPDEPPNSWWTLDFPLFASQKYVDEMMLNRALSAHPSKALAIYFPQFLADISVFGTKYLSELKEVATFFHEKGFHLLIYLGRPDYDPYAAFIDPVRNSSSRLYLLGNINRTLLYSDIHDYIDEVTLCWMGDVLILNYSSQEISEYNKQIRNLVNSVGIPFLVHVDGTWFEENMVRNGYTPQSVSPIFGCSDGLWAESWAQGVLPNCLNQLIPKYLTSSQMNMVCDVPNGYINPSTPNTPGKTVEEDMDYWFRCIQNVGITSWYVWDYYGSFEHVPSSYSLIYPNATTLTRKGEFVRSITQTGILYKDVAVTNFEKYRTVLGQRSNTKINLTILNQGDFQENVNISVYANTTIIHTQNISLGSGESEKIDILWNATLPLGNYTTLTKASIEGDVDTSDNIIVSGLITITIPGDVNADGRVDILDIAIAARAFGTRQGNERWEANVDVNEDGIIDILDIAMIAKEFGTTT